MSLEKYQTKRNFNATPEPSENDNKKSGGLKFVIQRHDATRLHYDFRLEMEGVLKSWAVPKGPSLNPHDKRLAMMVEDHPFSYRTFEGEIPKGNYGAGIVEIWDEGTYHALTTDKREESEKLLLEQLEDGSLKFVMHGKKLKGEFALVKIKNDEKNAWLLIKHNDEYAVDEEYSSENDVSVNSKIIKKENKNAKTNSQKKKTSPNLKGNDKMPHEIKPMLAKVSEVPFDDNGWIFEIKLDGYRAIAEVENGAAKLYSRNLISFNKKYPLLIESLKTFPHDVVLDGEVVVINENGNSDFQALQQYEVTQNGNLCFYVFDLIFIDGHDISGLPLIERKNILKEIIPPDGPIKFNDHIENDGKAFFALAKSNHLEGIMAKKSDSLYSFNARSGNWLKIKLFQTQEAVICGFTDPRGSRKDFGALILGIYENERLAYIGHTGGGFNTSLLSQVKKELAPLIQTNSPFDVKIKTNEKVTWVRPQLVCEVSFSEWTTDGHLRQPIFQRMRIDKEPGDVHKETENNIISADMKKIIKKNHVKETYAIQAENEEKPNAKAKVLDKNMEVESNGHKLKITNLNKVYWPEEGFTKGDVIDYYQKISEYMLPYLIDRPESLNRHPSGINGDNFFQKDMGDSLPEWIESKEVYSESNKKNINYLLCQNKETLMYLNNLGCIEINPWHSRVQNLDFPDYMMIDLDPGENTFDEVIEVALAVKEVLDKAGIIAYPKTSGATGMHIFVPLGAKYDFDQSKNFANIIVELVHEMLPSLTSLERSPKDRVKQIYLDYLQNRTGQTIAAAYSMRPKPGATVSTPLEWKEVKKGLHPSQFDFKNIFKRLDKKGDLFKNVLGKGIDIEKCLKKLGA